MLKFKTLTNRKKVSFIVYANFDSYIKPLHSCEPNPESSYTKQYQKHEPSCFCYCIKCFDDEVHEPKLESYTGEQKFVEMLEKDIREITCMPTKKMIFRKTKENDLTRKLNVGYVTENSPMMLKIVR